MSIPAENMMSRIGKIFSFLPFLSILRSSAIEHSGLAATNNNMMMFGVG
jgi:hypothetical protein